MVSHVAFDEGGGIHVMCVRINILCCALVLCLVARISFSSCVWSYVRVLVWVVLIAISIN